MDGPRETIENAGFWSRLDAVHTDSLITVQLSKALLSASEHSSRKYKTPVNGGVWATV